MDATTVALFGFRDETYALAMSMSVSHSTVDLDSA